jgi:hypothetical protein
MDILLSLYNVLYPPPNRRDWPPARITIIVFDLFMINSFFT